MTKKRLKLQPCALTVNIGETCRSVVGVMVLLLAKVGGFTSMLSWNWRANTVKFNAVETTAKKKRDKYSY